METTPPEMIVFDTSAPTPLDLKFRWFGFPTRVHPLFWLTTLLLGPLDLRGEYAVEAILMWMFAAFVSILMHELGHALAYRFYRCGEVRIELVAFGGLAIASRNPRGNYRRIAVALAGPAMQFLIVLLLWLSTRVDPFWPLHWFPYVLFFYSSLFAISLMWAIFNLLPIYPLDGGHVCREVCHILKVAKPLEKSLKISVGTAVGLIGLAIIAAVQPALISWVPSWFPIPSCLFTILMLASLGYSNYLALQAVQANPWGHGEDDREPWEQ